MSVRILVLALCALLWGKAAPAQSTHPVTALVGGQPVTIGTINATIGVSRSAFGLTGKEQSMFTFTDGWGSLDTAYDFHWVQIIQQAGNVTFYNYTGKQQFNTANAPFIDAPPGGYDYEGTSSKPGDDFAPFYEHEDTAQAPGGGAFAFSIYAFQNTHTEGKMSGITDFPSLGFNGGVFMATDFLVVTHPETANRTFTPEAFDVLGGYTWTETFTGNAVTPGDPVFVDADPALLNTALTRSGFAAAWQAVNGTDLAPAPEPSALFVLLTGITGLFILRARGTLARE